MIDRARLIARDRVCLHELLARLPDRRCLPCCQFGCTRIIPSSNLDQPVLRDRPRLLDGQFAKAADRRLARSPRFVRFWSMNTLRTPAVTLQRKPGAMVSRSS